MEQDLKQERCVCSEQTAKKLILFKLWFQAEKGRYGSAEEARRGRGAAEDESQTETEGESNVKPERRKKTVNPLIYISKTCCTFLLFNKPHSFR